MKEILIRFLIGGVAVSFFSVLGDVFKPKSFAGLFGAAPSVALATLGLAIMKDGREYAATEAGVNDCGQRRILRLQLGSELDADASHGECHAGLDRVAVAVGSGCVRSVVPVAAVKCEFRSILQR